MISGRSSSGNKNLVRAVKMDFTVKRGNHFSYTYDITTIDANGDETAADLTGYSAQMQLKRKKSDSNYFTVMAVNIDTAGKITFYKTGADMQIPAGTYWYDLNIQNADGENVSWIEGKFKILQDITEWVDYVEEEIYAVLESFFEFVKGKSAKYPVVFNFLKAFEKGISKKVYVAFEYIRSLEEQYAYYYRVSLGSIVSFIMQYKQLLSVYIPFEFVMAISEEWAKYFKIKFEQTYLIGITIRFNFASQFYNTYSFTHTYS